MIIIGIDPSLNGTGFGVIRKNGSKLEYITSGVILQKQAEVFSIKLLNIADAIEDIIQEFKPSIAAIEETYVNLNAQTSLKLGAVRGALIVTLARKSLPIIEVSPAYMKKTIVGNGNATKDQVAFMINKILCNLPKGKIFKTEDETDALGIAISSATK
jgi:crossover junction endodeoxyribonuclease RuvC